jgi:RHS repeat-associated protein
MRIEQGQNVSISASYTYDDSGYRASGSVTVTVGGTPTTTNTNYLTDTNNPTGYTQVFEEHVGGSSSPSMSYIIGLAVLAQTNASGATSYLMVDAQGSTRQLTDSSGNITARFAFDAYGNLVYVAVGVLNPPATKILYVGQLFDVALQLYVLRARLFDAGRGRFTTSDPIGASLCDPGNLDKYVYGSDDPVNRTDPSGLMSLAELSAPPHR